MHNWMYGSLMYVFCTSTTTGRPGVSAKSFSSSRDADISTRMHMRLRARSSFFDWRESLWMRSMWLFTTFSTRSLGCIW